MAEVWVDDQEYHWYILVRGPGESFTEWHYGKGGAHAITKLEDKHYPGAKLRFRVRRINSANPAADLDAFVPLFLAKAPEYSLAYFNCRTWAYCALVEGLGADPERTLHRFEEAGAGCGLPVLFNFVRDFDALIYYTAKHAEAWIRSLAKRLEGGSN